MKKLRFFPLIFLALALSACGVVHGSGHMITETRSIGYFDEITLAGSGDVIIKQGDEISLEIEAEDNLMRYLQSDVHGDTLILGERKIFPGLSLWPTRPIKFYVTVIDIETITLSGSGNILANVLDSKDIDIHVLGSGDIHLNELEAKTLTVKITGSGDVKIETLAANEVMATISGSGTCNLEGNTRDQSLRIIGSGDYRASELESENAWINIIGSGNGYVMVKDDLDVRITGSGDLRYSGTPQVNQTIIGSGDLLPQGSH